MKLIPAETEARMSHMDLMIGNERDVSRRTGERSFHMVVEFERVGRK